MNPMPMVVQVLKRHGKVRNLLGMLLRVANKLIIKAIRGWKGHFQKLNEVSCCALAFQHPL